MIQNMIRSYCCVHLTSEIWRRLCIQTSSTLLKSLITVFDLMGLRGLKSHHFTATFKCLLNSKQSTAKKTQR